MTLFMILLMGAKLVVGPVLLLAIRGRDFAKPDRTLLILGGGILTASAAGWLILLLAGIIRLAPLIWLGGQLNDLSVFGYFLAIAYIVRACWPGVRAKLRLLYLALLPVLLLEVVVMAIFFVGMRMA